MSNASLPFVLGFTGDIVLKLCSFEEVGSNEINNLLKLTRQFKGIKMERFIWKLNGKASIKYRVNEEFRMDVQSCMLNPHQALELVFCKMDIQSLSDD